MSEIKHTPTENENHNEIIVDADEHFVINTVTRAISPASNKKLMIMQYDDKSERYSFDIDKIIDGHDLTKCNRVQVHFNNIGSNRQHNAATYPVDDVQVNPSDDTKLTFTWLIGNEATQYSGILSFLVTFECVDGDKILYRWSSSIFNSIQIGAGMDFNNAVFEIYSDELLKWQVSMETEYIPGLVDDCYINREFATSEEVGNIFDIYDPVENELIGIDVTPTDGSKNLVESGGVKSYVDAAALKKLDVEQGTTNANKTMVTDEDGNITTLDLNLNSGDRQSIDFAEAERLRVEVEGSTIHENKLNKICAGIFLAGTYTTPGGWQYVQLNVSPSCIDYDYFDVSQVNCITIKKKGLYRISAQVSLWSSFIPGFSIMKNNELLTDAYSAVTTYTVIPASIVAELDVDDVIRFYASAQSASQVEVSVPEGLGMAGLRGWDIMNIETRS